MKKKIFYLLLVIILFTIFINSQQKISTKIKSYLAPNTITSSSSNTFTSPINNKSINILNNSDGNPLYSLMMNAEYPGSTENFENMDNNPTTFTDDGMSYIINHGYSKDSYSLITGATNDNEKYFVTQTAIWLYIYENKTKFTNYCLETDNSYSTCDFLDSSNNVISSNDVRTIINNISSTYPYAKSIITLVDGAENAKESYSLDKIDSNSITYKIADDEKSLTTSDITPVTSDNMNYYIVSITNPNNYTVEILDSNNKVVSGQLTKSFKIKVSFDDITKVNLSSIKIKVTANFSNIGNSISEYRVTSSTNKLTTTNKHQRYTNLLYPESQSSNVSEEFNLYNITRTRKIDADSKKMLGGAVLEVKDSSSNVVSTFTTSADKPTYLHLNAGNYSICEKTAPNGYSKMNNCIDFTVDSSKITKLDVPNNVIVNVPDTFKSIIKFSYIIGTVLITAGIIIFAYVKNDKIKFTN